MSGLSAEDVDDLRDWWDGEREGDTSGSMLGRLDSTVAEIVTRHVLDALTDAESRCGRAAGELLAMATTAAEAERADEFQRLIGKRDGVRLAMSYLDEAVRAAADPSG